MQLPHLYRELNDQLSQWIQPRDQRHLEGVSEAVAAILQSESACLNHWLPYLSHRGCTARSHHARLNYLLINPQVDAETFYAPLLKQLLQAFAGTELLLTLDTSVLWDQFCWVGVCFVWGGRSFTLAQTVLELRTRQCQCCFYCLSSPLGTGIKLAALSGSGNTARRPGL